MSIEKKKLGRVENRIQHPVGGEEKGTGYFSDDVLGRPR
jgi:hypothetical protein